MGDRLRIALVCSECEARNYQTTKVRKVGDSRRIELKKYCRSCNKHTLHRESR